MYVFTGLPVHSEVACAKLLCRLNKAGVKADALYDKSLYFIASRQSLAASVISKLEQILQAQYTFSAPEGEYFLILPRQGTVSSWSSKATDILHISGLTQIDRLEHGRLYFINGPCLDKTQWQTVAGILHDPMLERVCASIQDAEDFFEYLPSRPLLTWQPEEPIEEKLHQLNQQLILGLSDEEITYLTVHYQSTGCRISDIELQMFAQINSEHCRHKIFNARWTVNGQAAEKSLFDMIRNTFHASPEGVLSAYSDNAAVIKGAEGSRWQVNPRSREYEYVPEALPILIKVETHNHPTAISPFPGAATGSGGEIRDEAAVGRGGRPKAGLCGYTVSNLRIPGFEQKWEGASDYPDWVAKPLQIMLEAPIGAASFNNEFGRPCLNGYFRTFEQQSAEQHWGYHKPIMIAGGFGNVREQHVHKRDFPAGTPIVVLGGPAMLIGLAGGSASSQAGGSGDKALHYASVQRDNAEMQRRCQEVIERCISLGDDNPILSIHDVGAGGLSNAVPELLYAAKRGACIQLRDIPVADSSLSPMEIWCNEAQERYVIAVAAGQIELFTKLCHRERCPMAVIGYASDQDCLVIEDRQTQQKVVDIPMTTLLGKFDKLHKNISLSHLDKKEKISYQMRLSDAIQQVFSLPAVAAKQFLITIGDRTVGGLTVRDQLLGPWQIPVADCAVCMADFSAYAGELMAMGERTPVALYDPCAAARMAVGEAIMNSLAADIQKLSDIRLSANWMAACGVGDNDAALYLAVRAVGEELCPALGIAVPVGKDSLSMQLIWQTDHDNAAKSVVSPTSLIVSAFAPVSDVRRCLTPQLLPQFDSVLLLFDLSRGKQRMGGSAFAQVYQQTSNICADLDDPAVLCRFAQCITALRNESLLTAYHDRSDGGLLVTICEMMFAGHCGVSLEVDILGDELFPVLFNEELGAVVQVEKEQMPRVMMLIKAHGLTAYCTQIGKPIPSHELQINHRGQTQSFDLQTLKQQWWQTSFYMQSLRDNPECAREELEAIGRMDDPGLHIKLNTDVYSIPTIKKNFSPKVAILREQGVNGQMEMAAAFQSAGFQPIDVHMNDLLEKPELLGQFNMLAACGGFSYGDVLGGGRGWASSILFNEALSNEFAKFFARDNTLTLGICNGCQMLSHLQSLIPGTAHWPQFTRNRSEQFESRIVMVEIQDSPCVFLQDMDGARLPIVVAHGEGKAVFTDNISRESYAPYTCLRYVDNWGKQTEQYPANPNGSPQGITGICSEDGRVLIMMPHPERLFRDIQYSWRHTSDTDHSAPWLKLFYNAYRFYQ